jgi:predicted RNA binding protein YcfA (HicA-like mRNA interferase family)
VSPRLPQVSGRTLVAFLEHQGYTVLRQRGSHVRLVFQRGDETHFITVPNHKVIAKGTLGDILTAVSRATGVPKSDLIELLRRA